MSLNGEMRAESIVGHIDDVAVVGAEPVDGSTIPFGSSLSIRGWVLDRETGNPLDELRFGVAGGTTATAVLRLPRPDVKSALPWARSEAAGFYAVVPVDVAAETAELVLHGRSGVRTVTGNTTVALSLAPAMDPLSGLTERADGWIANLDGFFCGDRLVDAAEDGRVAVIPFDELTLLRLWVIDTRNARPPATLIAQLGGRYCPVYDGDERIDAALSVEMPAASRCGYTIAVLPPLANVSYLRIYALFEDGTFARLPPLGVRLRDQFPAELLPGTASVTAAVDQVHAGERAVDASAPIVLGRGERVRIRGWAVDERGPRLSGGVDVRLANGSVQAAEPGDLRPDVAAHYHNQTIAGAGFTVQLPTETWLPGQQRVALRVYSARGEALRTFAELDFVVQ